MKKIFLNNEPDKNIQDRRIRVSRNSTFNIYIAVDISQSIGEDHVQRAKSFIIAVILKKLLSGVLAEETVHMWTEGTFNISSLSLSPNYEIIFFSSEVYEIVNILDFWDNRVSLQSIIERLQNFDTAGKDTGTNMNQAFRTFWEKMALIKHRAKGAFKDFRHVIIFFTDGGYNIGDTPEPTVASIKDLVYMGDSKPSREEYLDIYIFATGVEVFQEDLQPLATGTGGRHYFRLKHDTDFKETIDQILDEHDVGNLCGLHKDYDITFDKIGKRKRYPWVAFVIIQGSEPKKCLGSLVSPNFVLTAAHCFNFFNRPEDVTVELEDRPGHIVKKVKTFKLHPDYNIKAKQDQGVEEFYDYDVALVQLEDAVDISAVARPICIPCTQETSDALKLVGVSTCAQQEQLLLKSQRERLSFLTRTVPLVQEKDVFAKLGESRNACINKALKANGVRVMDPTVVITNNFLCTGGLTEHRDHIACTGDGGGAVFKNFNHRTIQVALVSWGTNTFCSSGGLVESTEDSRDFHINLFRVIPFLKSILGNEDQDDYAPLTFLNE